MESFPLASQWRAEVSWSRGVILFKIIPFLILFQSKTLHSIESSFHSFHNSLFPLALLLLNILFACPQVIVADCFFFSS